MAKEPGAARVLVVDDDPFVLEMIAAILQDAGYEVLAAGNGAEALALFAAAAGIGLIVSDMNMPEMDGLGLIKAVRGAGADVPIIILTGNNEVTTAIQALKSGANDYLLKDENIQDTIGIAVEKVLEKHCLKEQNRRLVVQINSLSTPDKLIRMVDAGKISLETPIGFLKTDEGAGIQEVLDSAAARRTSVSKRGH